MKCLDPIAKGRGRIPGCSWRYKVVFEILNRVVQTFEVLEPRFLDDIMKLNKDKLMQGTLKMIGTLGRFVQTISN